MILRRPCSLLPLLVACTPIEPPARGGSAPEPTPVEEPAPPPVASAPAPSSVAQTLAWRWTSPRPPGELETMLPMPAHVDNGPTRVEARARNGGGVEIEQSLRGKSQWTAALGGTYAGAAALAWAGDVVVAHYHPIASGTMLARLDQSSGKTVWEVPLQGLGPVDHSKYRNDVQLEVLAGQVWVYGWESQGAYVEVRALEDGAQVDHSRVEPALVDLSWEELDGTERGFSVPPPWSMVVAEDAAPRLRFQPPGAQGVDVRLPHSFGRCDTGHGFEREGTFYLVHACSITSGALVHALSMEDWTWRWQTGLHGLGPIAHSAYSNAVQLSWVEGRLVVHGDEAMGRYAEAVDPASGATLVTKRWPTRG